MSSIQVLEDPETEQIMGLIKSGANIFITGPGGTGKSTLVRRIAELVNSVHVTAMTGCAALLLDCAAKTLHSWCGIGLGLDSLEKNIDTIKRKRHIKKRWTTAAALVIDEVSMLTPDLFERLDKIGRAVRTRGAGKPFGGLQLILVGDFCQLPPVTRYGGPADLRFLFESEIWASTIKAIVVLKKIWRQLDPVYQQVLSEVRLGSLSDESEAILRRRMDTDWRSESIKPTVLFSRNTDVDKVNDVNMGALDTSIHTFAAVTVIDKSKWTDAEMTMPDKSSDIFKFAVNKLDTDAPYSAALDLREGAQVMLLTNMDIDKGLVNGSRGIITGFALVAGRSLPVVKFKKGEPCIIEPYVWYSHDMPHIGRQQIPLRIAYAITIHKSQGASIDSAIVDIGKSTFEYGQAYVALSRVRSLEGLHIYALDVSKIKTHPRVLEFYKGLAATSSASGPLGSASASGTLGSATAGPFGSAPMPYHPSWAPVIEPHLSSVTAFVAEERKTKTIYPPEDKVFACLSMPVDDVKVVILGQDPYHGSGQAIGYAFAIDAGVKVPPSLKNICKEIATDLGVDIPDASCINGWASQGVLLLNTILTVEDGKPLSHANKGWENVTDAIIKHIAANNPRCVFILWGKSALKTATQSLDQTISKSAATQALDQKAMASKSAATAEALIDIIQTNILTAAHPSPLSAHHGFFGCRHFSKTNAMLIAAGLKPVSWLEER
jgi:ATP-dependent DNA helicase PIF1